LRDNARIQVTHQHWIVGFDTVLAISDATHVS